MGPSRAWGLDRTVLTARYLDDPFEGDQPARAQTAGLSIALDSLRMSHRPAQGAPDPTTNPGRR
jgi:hypothetical protein